MDKNNVLLYSTGNYAQYPVISHNGKEYEKECEYIYIYIYIYRNHFSIEQKLTQHFKSTILQQNKFLKKEEEEQQGPWAVSRLTPPPSV